MEDMEAEMELNELRNRPDLDKIALQAEQDNDSQHPGDLFRLILDRLTAPAEPEVDEATKVTRKILEAWHSDDPAPVHDDHYASDIVAATNVLREFIAGKDAEIAKAQLWAMEQHKCADEYASELAALRAEIERRKANEAHLRQLLSIQEGISDTVHETLWAADKAAERNPAEPNDNQCTPSRADESDNPFSVSQVDGVRNALADRVGTSAASCSSDGSGVEVQQVDREFVSEICTCVYPSNSAEHRSYLRGRVSEYRTEAEARGRREALEEAKEYVRPYLENLDSRHEATLRGIMAEFWDGLERLLTEGK